MAYHGLMGEARDRIIARLEAEGRMPMADFMAMALYGPGGYYATPRKRIGPDGDFYTSPTVHPAFATLLAVQIAQIWALLGQPAEFDVVEVGGGKGTLAADLIHSARDTDRALEAAIRYTLIDLAPPEAPVQAAFRPAAEGLPPFIKGVVLANEFLDAFPVHRVQKLQGKLQELYVEKEGDRLIERPGPLSSAQLAAHVSSWMDLLPEGGKAEASPDRSAWIATLSRSLDRGAAILIDYGAERPELAKRREGTLRGFWRHRVVDDAFFRIGEADLTCHVDFTAVKEAAKSVEMTILGEIDQTGFLQNLGHHAIEESLRHAPLDAARRQANLSALQDLVSPRGLGAFRVLILGKNLPEAALYGLEGGGTPANAPVLTRRHMTLWGPPQWQEVDLLVDPAGDLD